MPADFDRLKDALNTRYLLVRELGSGGMATVYLAEDLRHRRKVAIKVLRPDLAASLGSDRFLREIEILGSLNHPHILPLLDSGQTADALFYVMPFVEGESLRHRLDREKQLPVDVALQIADEVADALSHAHHLGIVHRDIKPENILLSAGHAVVADFGIARAVDAAGGRLTETGLAIGTPAYMSPEQGAGDVVDGRSDIYSLATVLYEMLTGTPPFIGVTPQVIIARKAVDPVPRISVVRESVIPALEATIMKALARTPADRFETVEQFRTALGQSQQVSRTTAIIPARSRAWQAWLGAAALVLFAGMVTWKFWSSPAGSLDDRVVAIMPFRITGNDPTLGYLEEGIVDLLAVKLTGDQGPRAVEPRPILSALNRRAAASPSLEDMREIARRFGASRLVVGSVIGTSHQLVLTASMIDVRTGKTHSRTSVEGVRDSLAPLLDRLTAALLLSEAGEREVKLATLTTLPALQSFLAGQTAYRQSDYSEACTRYREALQRDSTFAQAALGMARVASWVGFRCPPHRALNIARRYVEKLNQRDRLWLTELEDTYGTGPAAPREISRLMVEAAPDDPEAWFKLGDHYFHGSREQQERATAAFRRSIELDSGYVPTLEHLLEIAATKRDTGEVRLLSPLYARREAASELAGFIHWYTAVMLGDSAGLARIRNRFDSLPRESLIRILSMAQLEAVALEDAERASRVLARAADDPNFLAGALQRSSHLAANRGHPTALRALVDSMSRFWTNARVLHIRYALYWDGDTAAAAMTAQAIAPRADAALESEPRRRSAQLLQVCALEQWRVAHGILDQVPAGIRKLRQATEERDGRLVATQSAVCAALLEGLLAVHSQAPQRLVTVLQVDSLIENHPLSNVEISPQYYWLPLARLLAAVGRPERALAVLRNRGFGTDTDVILLSTLLREEGRLAAATGDRAGAIRVYQTYLRLRSNAEPALRPAAEQVRAELAGLLQGR